jgi:hypothetical protein
MRSDSKRTILCAVAVLLGSMGLMAHFSSESYQIRYRLAALQRDGHMLEVLAGLAPQTRSDRLWRAFRLLNRKDTNSSYGDSCMKHREALLRLGYLARREFAFPTQALAVAELRTNALHLMSNYTATYWLSQSQAVVQVVARPVEMRAWVELIGELDRRHSP